MTDLEQYRYQDDRRPEHSKLRHGVTARDSFMSGWGPGAEAPGGSVAVWVCTGEQLPHVLKWIQSRDEMRAVHDRDDMHELSAGVAGKRWPGALVHVYVVHESHPSLAVFEAGR